VCALATATLVLVAMLASQLVLSAVAALGVVHEAVPPARPGTVQGTLVSAETDKPTCGRHHDARGAQGARVDRCEDQRRSAGGTRP